MNNGNQELKVYLYKEYEESGKNWRALNKNQIIFLANTEEYFLIISSCDLGDKEGVV